MRYLKCNLPPERHEEILAKFWHYPTQEEEDAVHDMFTPHVFFETYGSEREAWATCCRQHGIIGKRGPKHGSEASCPFCGQTAVWNAIGKYGEQMRSLREETHVAFLRRDGDALLIEAMQIEISYTKDLIYGGIYYDMNCWGQKAYYLAPGTVQMWVRTREWRCGEWALPYWKAKTTVSEPFQPNMMGWACYQGDYTVIGADALSETKAWRYCQIEDWMCYELRRACNEPVKWAWDEPVKWAVTYVSALNNSGYLFTGTILNYPVVLSIGALGSATVYLYGTYLPDPNPDDSDDGKSLVVNGHKWAMKKAAVDDAMSSTSTNPVQNKVMKSYVDTKVSGLQTADQVQAAISSAITGVYTPKGSIAFASLPTAAAGNKGWVYNITDAFTTTAAFVEGAGHAYGAGTNVVCVDAGSGSYKWDVLAGTIDLTELTADEVQKLWDSI